MSIINYSVLTQGNSTFIRAFSVPLAEELEKLNSIKASDFPNRDVFAVDSSINNIDTAVAGIFGVLLFLPSWFAIKILDDLYEIKIKPRIQSIIKRADSIEIFKSQNKFFVHSFSIYHEELDVIVIVAAKEKGLDELYGAIEQLNNFVQTALNNLKTSPQESQVQLYILTEGRINVVPFIHENIESAIRQINS